MTGQVEIVDHVGCSPRERALAAAAAAQASAVGASTRSVHVLLADDAEIARLHGDYLGDPRSTDVLSFVLDDSIEVAVNVACARREARARAASFDAELALYVAHGVLHACGFDDVDSAAAARMRVAERRVLDELGLRSAPVE